MKSVPVFPTSHRRLSWRPYRIRLEGRSDCFSVRTVRTVRVDFGLSFGILGNAVGIGDSAISEGGS
jgi:hypothetical protein